jgi:FMN-dependent NADH-azoreductase
MKTLLEIRSSIYSDGGQSSRLADRFVAQWRAANPGGKVIVRDLARDPVPHIDADRFGAFNASPEQRTAQQNATVAYSGGGAELKAAHVIVFAVPMYNTGIPSTLKAYFDPSRRGDISLRRRGRSGSSREERLRIRRSGRYASAAGLERHTSARS